MKYLNILTLLALLLLFLTVGTEAAYAQSDIIVDIQYACKPDAIEAKVTVSPDALCRFTGVKAIMPNLFGLVNADSIDHEKAIAFIKKYIHVKVDGIVVPPLFLRKCVLIASSEIDSTMATGPWYAQIVLSYPLKSDINDLAIQCDDELFDELAPFGADPAVDPAINVAELTGKYYVSNIMKAFILNRDEPAFEWDKDGQKVPDDILRVKTDQPFLYKAKTTFLGFSIASMAIFTISCFLKLKRKIKIAIITLAFLLSVSSGSYAYMLSKYSDVPPQAEAVEIFKALHANIYRSFDYQTESDIYDSLAQSVSGPILNEIYEMVYLGLVVQEKGGAVCSVDKVEVLDTHFIPLENTDIAQYQVSCCWRVWGIVAHWEHNHKRVNEYNAVYTVSDVDGQWRITDSKVTKQQRVD